MQMLVGEDPVFGLTLGTGLPASRGRGRIRELATAGDILKVVTAEAEVRGRGDVVVIRSESPAETRVSALRGWFRVKSPRGTLFLDGGQAAVITADGAPEMVELPDAPTGLNP